MIRVFPRRTNWTPDDSMSFIGDPPIFRPEEDMPVRVSCTFTWDIEEAERLSRSWSRFYSDVQVGGPAYDAEGDDFIPGRFVKKGVVITSRGCSKNCDWCLVPGREGRIREMPVKEGWDVADNNLLACSMRHIESVFEMLKVQPHPIKFSGGLDAELLTEQHVELLRTIRLKFAWFACDYPGALTNLKKVSELMSDFSIEKKRCYVLVGFNGESIAQAEKRLEAVYRLGFLPMAMLYQPIAEKKKEYCRDWKRLIKTWSRPAAYKAEIKKKETAKWQPHMPATLLAN